MKVVIIGSNGQLGNDLNKGLQSVDIIPLSHSEIEVSDLNSVKHNLTKHKPDIVINTAAFHNVDDCEIDHDKAFKVNALGARNVAVVTQNLGAKLMHISTDYVFGGEKEKRTTPFTEFDVPIPVSNYGKSKLVGENFIKHLCTRYFIVRVSGLFGISGSSGKGGNFVETMIKLGKEKTELRVVNDLIFSPTFTEDLVKKINQLIHTEYYGIFHITNSNSCSWYEFTKEILKLNGINTFVIPISSEQFPQKAKRPIYSVLGHYHLHLLGMDDLRSWQKALEDYLIKKGHIKI